jgi:hypothetical protein
MLGGKCEGMSASRTTVESAERLNELEGEKGLGDRIDEPYQVAPERVHRMYRYGKRLAHYAAHLQSEAEATSENFVPLPPPEPPVNPPDGFWEVGPNDE